MRSKPNTGLPVFSTIPLSAAQANIAKRRLTGATGVRLLAIEHPDDLAVESLRSLRTAMQFAMLESPNNRVMITGATPGVGKSFVTANFAALMAAAGKRTLLIDADLRRGHMHQYFGLQRHGGLSELIAGSLTVQQTVHRQVVPNLDFLATGQLPPNPAELLVSDSFKTTLERLSEQYDLVVIDTPPVLVAADTATVATHAGTVLLVARAEPVDHGRTQGKHASPGDWAARLRPACCSTRWMWEARAIRRTSTAATATPTTTTRASCPKSNRTKEEPGDFSRRSAARGGRGVSVGVVRISVCEAVG